MPMKIPGREHQKKTGFTKNSQRSRDRKQARADELQKLNDEAAARQQYSHRRHHQHAPR